MNTKAITTNSKVERSLTHRDFVAGAGLVAASLLGGACAKCHQEIVVPFSCKCRGACPSCSARRMDEAAAHLVDRVLPDVPVRQGVLTAPNEVRRVLALRLTR